MSLQAETMRTALIVYLTYTHTDKESETLFLSAIYKRKKGGDPDASSWPSIHRHISSRCSREGGQFNAFNEQDEYTKIEKKKSDENEPRS